jgi:uncharacterized membrane protein YbhN (UPF0104 family)
MPDALRGATKPALGKPVIASPPTPQKRTLILLLKAALSIALILLVARHVDFGALALQLHHVNLGLLALSAGLILLQTIAGAMRWQAIMAAQSGRIDLLTTFRIYYIGVFFATFTPGGIFGDVVRVWHAHRVGLILSSAISSVILDRLIVVAYLVAITIATVHLLPPEIQARFPLGAASALLLIALLAGLVAPLAIRRLPAKIRSHASVGKLVALSDSVLLVTMRPLSLIWILLLTAVSQALLCGAIGVLSRSIGGGVGFVDFMILMPPVILASILPISIGGWGMRETAMVFTLSLVGVAPESAFLLSVLVGVLALAMSLPGGVLWLLFPRIGILQNSTDGREINDALHRRQASGK